MEIKICSRCRQRKTLQDFYTHHRTICKECIILYTKQWVKENRIRHNERGRKYYRKNKNKIRQYMKKYRKQKLLWFVEYKKNHPCEICGESDYRCLVFHHPNKRSKNELAIPAMINYTKQKIMEAMASCQIICANCHAKIHYKENEINYIHKK